MNTTVGKKKRTRAGKEAARALSYHARKRAEGFRQVRFWVPDTRSPAFVRQAREQARAVATSPMAEEDQAFIDAISEWNDAADE